MPIDSPAARADVVAGLSVIARSCHNQRGPWRKRLWRFERNPAAIDDILQEALLQAHMSIDNYRGEATLETWFSAVLTNVARQHVAREVRRGGILVTARVEDSRADAAAAILRDSSVVDIAARRRDYEAEGWEGFDEASEPYPADQIRDYRAGSVAPPILRS